MDRQNNDQRIPLKKIKIAKAISVVVMVLAAAIIVGWIFNIGYLKSLSPNWVTMKITTSIIFIFSGMALYAISMSLEGKFDIAQIVLSITSLVILLVMGIMFISTFFGVRTGVEDIIIHESSYTTKTMIPGQPSIPTMLNFLLIATTAISTILNINRLHFILRFVGVWLGLTGLLALLGYIINVPLLYYFIEGRNSAMAFNTAILFVLLGVGFTCLSD